MLVDHPGATDTDGVFTELLINGGAVVLCGGNHHPAGHKGRRLRDRPGAELPAGFGISAGLCS